MKLKSFLISKSANTQAFFNILGPLIMNGVNFFTLPVFTRLLGTQNYGVLAIYTTWTQVFSVIIGLQTGNTISAASIYIAKEENKKYLSSIMSLSICSFFLIMAIVGIFMEPISNFMGFSRMIVWLLLLQSFGTFCVQFATAKFVFFREGLRTFLLSTGTTLITVLLSLLLILNIDDYNNRYLGKIYGMAIPYLIIGIGIVLVVLLRGRTLFNWKYWKFCLPISIPFIFNGLSSLVLTQCDKLMLQHFTNDSIVGIYSFSFTFSHVVNILLNAVNNTWMPFYFEYAASGDIDVLRKRTKNCISVFSIISMGFILLSPEVIQIFASKDFWSGIDLIPVLVLAMYMIFLYNFPVNYQIYHKKTVTVALGTVAAAACNIGLNLALIPRYGMYGAAVATLISYVLLFLFHEVIAKYCIVKGYQYSMKTFLPGILSLLICTGVFYFCKELWWIRWGLGAILGFVLLYRLRKQKSIF